MAPDDDHNTGKAPVHPHCPPRPPCCGCCCPQYFPPKPPKPPKPCPPRPMIPKGKDAKKPPHCGYRPRMCINWLGIALLAPGLVLVALCVPVWCWPVVIGAALIVAGCIIMRCG